MKIHSYYYGPIYNGEFDLQTSEQLTNIIQEDIIRNLYTMEGSPTEKTQFSKLYDTPNGPVIGITRIEPSQSLDKRSTITNRTIFVTLSDFVNELSHLLDTPQQFPVRTQTINLK